MHSFTLLVLLGLVVAVIGEDEEAQLPLLVFNGRLLNDRGEPVNGAQVQFWQTDRHGHYDHPQSDRGGIPLESGFQYFGTASTVKDGSFQFRTQRPGVGNHIIGKGPAGQKTDVRTQQPTRTTYAAIARQRPSRISSLRVRGA